MAASLTVESDQSFAIVTPSYVPDLSRCELLAESLDRTAPNINHYIIVSEREHAAFRHLKSNRRDLIHSEEILGSRIHPISSRHGFAVGSNEMPVAGWVIQQILKVGITKVVPERTMVFCDSDYAFFRPFGRDDLLVDGKMGLLDIAWQNDNTRRWTTIARRLLGLPHVDGGYRNHVGSMICWNREIVTLMQQRIEVASGMNWRIALALTSDFSEYMIYGILVRELLGYASVDHAPSTVPLVKLCYGVSLHNVSAFDSFFAHLDPRTVAVMIHSKDGVDPILYRRYLEHLWKTHAR
jgi:Family of unknown function (DUF6492)